MQVWVLAADNGRTQQASGVMDNTSDHQSENSRFDSWLVCEFLVLTLCSSVDMHHCVGLKWL